MTIALSHAALQQAVTDLDAAAERLRQDQEVAADRVAGFLDGGWSGPAATAFDSAWVLWCAGARDVLDGLRATRRLVAAAHHDLSVTDQRSEERLQVVASRLVERLG